MQFKSNLLLLLAAAIWGFAFVAQRVGMDFVGPFTFNGVRFILGAVSLLPLIFYCRWQAKRSCKAVDERQQCPWHVGLTAGIILFIAASLQQIGLIYTTAGKSAFITCLYIVLVPLTGIFLKQRIQLSTWLGSALAIIGLYFLCVKESFTIAYGDFLELVGAFFWAAHILFIDHYSCKVNTLQLAFFQFITCAVLSLTVAGLYETISINALMATSIPLLYGGICSVGIAYTLQIVGQKNASPSHAAIILSMETVFAAIGGWLILGEQLGYFELIGCALMMSGMLLSQLSSLQGETVAETTKG